MSHLIQYTLPLQAKTLLDFQQKTFIKPNFKIMARSSTQPDLFNIQEQMIHKICTRLSQKETFKLDKENHQMYQNYKSKLKNKKKSGFPSGSQIIQNIFTRDEDRTQEQIQRRKTKNHINVLKYLEKMPQKVYLHQRYNNAINQKMYIMAEAKQILKKKETFRKWADQNNNSPVKNPNFTKMTFLLEKLTTNKNIAKNLEQSSNSQSHQRLTKLLNCASKIPKQGHKQVKSAIPNITLEPISMNTYYAKPHHKWVNDTRATRDTEGLSLQK